MPSALVDVAEAAKSFQNERSSLEDGLAAAVVPWDKVMTYLS
jgi:hypothetical protein